MLLNRLISLLAVIVTVSVSAHEGGNEALGAGKEVVNGAGKEVAHEAHEVPHDIPREVGHEVEHIEQKVSKSNNIPPITPGLKAGAITQSKPKTVSGSSSLPHDTPPLPPLIPKGKELPVTCISRHIDTGEHKFDSNSKLKSIPLKLLPLTYILDNIIYTPFPICSETRQSLNFHFLTDEKFNCTFPLTDETYHLFQLYLHEDVPLTCRIPLSETEFLPITLDIRGDTEESHIDIDPTLNVVFFARPQQLPGKDNSIEYSAYPLPVSGIAFSSAYAQKQRHIIGNLITLQFDTKWYSGTSLPSYTSDHYTFGSTILYCLATVMATSIVVGAIFYSFLLPKRLRHHNDEYSKID